MQIVLHKEHYEKQSKQKNSFFHTKDITKNNVNFSHKEHGEKQRTQRSTSF